MNCFDFATKIKHADLKGRHVCVCARACVCLNYDKPVTNLIQVYAL